MPVAQLSHSPCLVWHNALKRWCVLSGDSCGATQDWTLDLLTEVHAVEYMQESMNGIMRVGLLSASPQDHHSTCNVSASPTREAYCSMLWQA